MENIEYVLPGEIEKRSFAIIGEELKERGIVLPPEQEPVTKRVIHTSSSLHNQNPHLYGSRALSPAPVPVEARYHAPLVLPMPCRLPKN